MAGRSFICNIRKNISVFTVVVIFLLVCEACMRIFFTPRFVNPEFYAAYIPNYKYGYDNNPLFFRRGDTLIPWISEYHNNRLEYTLSAEKSSDEVRIFVIGSSVLGKGKFNSIAFYLEKILNLSSSEGTHKRKFVIVNLSTDGLATDQLILLIKKSVKYKPDLFIVNINYLETYSIDKLILFWEAHRFPLRILVKSQLFCFFNKLCKLGALSPPVRLFNNLQNVGKRELLRLTKVRSLLTASVGNYNPQIMREIKQVLRSADDSLLLESKRTPVTKDSSYSLIKIIQPYFKKLKKLAPKIFIEESVPQPQTDTSLEKSRLLTILSELHEVLCSNKIHLLHLLPARRPPRAALINNHIFKTDEIKPVEEIILDSVAGHDYIHCLDIPEIFAKNIHYFYDPQAIFSDDRHWIPEAKMLVAREIAEFVKEDIVREGNIYIPEYPYLMQSPSIQTEYEFITISTFFELMISYEETPTRKAMEDIILRFKRSKDANEFSLFEKTAKRIWYLLFKDEQEESKFFDYFFNFINGWIKAQGYSLSEEN